MSATTTDFVATAVPAGKYLVDPYQDWAVAEGVPILTGRAIDLLQVETQPWPRFDARGALIHVDGRCDFLSLFLIEIAAGRATAPEQHVYDELIYVLSGSGETEIKHVDGSTRHVAWGPKTLIGPPAGARYRHRNTGNEPARLVTVNDLRYLISLYRNPQFVFGADGVGPLAQIPTSDAQPGTEGAAPAMFPFTPSVELGGPAAKGMGSQPLLVGSGTIGADLIAQAQVTYGRARRQMQGAHILGIEGEGLTMSWRDDESEQLETAWHHGIVAGLPGMHFHMHFNCGRGIARLLDIQLGSASYPTLRSRRNHYGDSTVYASGKAELPQGEAGPGPKARWLAEVASRGLGTPISMTAPRPKWR